MNREEYNAYMRKYLLEKYYRRKAEAISALGGSCVRCGSTEDLHFDHIDPTLKEHDLGKSFSGLAEVKLQAELLKCQLLCQPCHAQKTREDHGQENGRETHGTLTSCRYCKCDLCRGAKNEWNRKYYRGPTYKRKSRAKEKH